MTDSIDNRLHKALIFLGETDEELAKLRKEALYAEESHKQTLAVVFKASTGNVEERKAAARIKAEEKYIQFLEADMKFNALNNKRKTEMIAVEVLRSLKADRRRGNVV